LYMDKKTTGSSDAVVLYQASIADQ